MKFCASQEKITHSGVLEFISEEGTCYMPYWVRLRQSRQSRASALKRQRLAREGLVCFADDEELGTGGGRSGLR